MPEHIRLLPYSNHLQRRDAQLAKMVFGEGSKLSKDVLDVQLAQAKKLDELTGGISNKKVKEMKPGPEKDKLEIEVKKRKESHQCYKDKMMSSCVISDRVYINSIADRNKRAGKLGIGYGASQDKIGPEYGFGLSIAQKSKDQSCSSRPPGAANH